MCTTSPALTADCVAAPPARSTLRICHRSFNAYGRRVDSGLSGAVNRYIRRFGLTCWISLQAPGATTRTCTYRDNSSTKSATKEPAASVPSAAFGKELETMTKTFATDDESFRGEAFIPPATCQPFRNLLASTTQRYRVRCPRTGLPTATQITHIATPPPASIPPLFSPDKTRRKFRSSRKS